jgi:hypothetical protein
MWLKAAVSININSNVVLNSSSGAMSVGALSCSVPTFGTLFCIVLPIRHPADETKQARIYGV